jgi:hypothetical protein
LEDEDAVVVSDEASVGVGVAGDAGMVGGEEALGFDDGTGFVVIVGSETRTGEIVSAGSELAEGG